MELDVMGLLGACSYALECVEAELAHVTYRHARRVAYMSVCVARQMGISGDKLRALTACALMHDNALTQYIQEELHGDIPNDYTAHIPFMGEHCTVGERNMRMLDFLGDVNDVILYHHECADGSGPFGKGWRDVPLGARIIHMCDTLDAFLRPRTFSRDTWLRARDFLNLHRGDLFDDECVDAFVNSFTELRFEGLGGDDLTARLARHIPRTHQELSFAQIRALADFFAHIIDCKSPFTSTHSLGVARDAYQLSRFMGFDEEICEKMYLAGALHDIGKAAVGNEILEKPGRLTDEEFSVMKHHAAYTYAILSGVDDFEDMRDWAAFHHERLDGTGYPFGKTADELCVQARMMACIDIYQALSETRPYKQGMPHARACMILGDMAARGWVDADIVHQVDMCFAQS